MILTNIQHVSILLLMICAGVLCAMGYDFFRIIRRLFGNGFILTFLCDLLFWVLAFFIIFRFTYIASSGEMSIISFLFIIIGASLYFLGPSKIALKMLSYIQVGKKKIKKNKTYRYFSR